MTQPIVAGFFPDPSICRVGDDYYLVASSFEYAPGVPVFTSRDLTSWRQIGNVLDRPTQLRLRDGTGSSGIFAPTLRHHDGRFWMVTTNIDEVRRGALIVWAEDPAGPWSEPVYVTGPVGIDPDLCWGDDGVCHLTWASFLPQLHGIVSAPIDPLAGSLLAEPRRLWQGTGLVSPEAPHLYRIDGRWYLLLAEGGTERGHAVTVARADSLDGPWESDPANPILSHRSTGDPVQNTGHADLVERGDGSWAMVHLGVRPRGRSPRFHVNGRESFVVGIDWVEGWPRVDESAFVVQPADHDFDDDFAAQTLDARWISPGVFAAEFTRRNAADEFVVDAAGARSLLAVRARDETWTATVRLRVEGSARFLVRIDDQHWYGLTVDQEQVSASLVIGPATSVLAVVPRPAGGTTTLRLRSLEAPRSRNGFDADEPDLVELALVSAEGAVHVLATVDGRYLSTEVAGGFTGRVIGVAALVGSVVIEHFSYRAG